MKFRPPFAHETAVDVQEAADGRIHCVCQTRSVSGSGDVGDAVERLTIFILIRRHAVPAGWQVDAFGHASDDPRRSRFGMVGLVWPSAWYVASPDASLIELIWIGSPPGLLPL